MQLVNAFISSFGASMMWPSENGTWGHNSFTLKATTLLCMVRELMSCEESKSCKFWAKDTSLQTQVARKT